MQDVIEQDANDWLDGKNPLDVRSNYGIANQFVEAHPGHSRTATHRRIMGKLAKKRHLMSLLRAWEISEDSRPFAVYFRAAQALAAHDPKFGELVLQIADMDRGRLERYRETFGEPPAEMTIKAIETVLAQPANALSTLGQFRSAPLGLLGQIKA